MFLRPFGLLLLAAVAQASLLTLKSPRFIVADGVGTQLRAEPISLEHRTASPVKLGGHDTLRLTFQVVDKDEGNGVQPHQTFLRFYDETTGEEGIQPIKVAANGKAKFDLNLSKPPLSLPPTPKTGSGEVNPLQLTLLIGSPDHEPLSVRLFDIILPPSQPAPVHPDEVKFHPQGELFHTFRPDQKVPNKFISFVFSGIALAPWVVLLGLWSQVAPKPTSLLSPSILPFILSLGAFETLLFTYWVKLKLFDVLFYGAGLAVVTIFTGRQALSSISAQRKD